MEWLAFRVLKGLRSTKKATEANWPSKYFILHFPGPLFPLLMKISRILLWRGQGFSKTHFKLVNHEAKTLLPTLAAKAQCWQHSRTQHTFHCIERAGFCRPSLTRSQGRNTFSFSNTITCQTQSLYLLVTQTSKQRISVQHNCPSLLANLLHLPFKAPCCPLPHKLQKPKGITKLIVLCHQSQIKCLQRFFQRQ